MRVCLAPVTGFEVLIGLPLQRVGACRPGTGSQEANKRSRRQVTAGSRSRSTKLGRMDLERGVRLCHHQVAGKHPLGELNWRL